ncbi:FAD-binding oxidoreductase [Bradyrhizobium sp. ARR65]|uniref:FAD-binding oxidoreductase n=1 Tax=Bradyrhizobium sp. ARR65 TaxID=1040989 RepID=UPI0004667C3B|nr:FAD-binding oxidoreductase [Bradyrhizobium sp. ARR65]
MTDLTEKALRRLGERLPGRVSRPGHGRYRTATALWAKPTGAMPQAVVHCRTAVDVQAAIDTARRAGLPLSVRGGGHDWAGRALCDGLVLDLADMRDVIISPDRRSALAGGGARIADVLVATDRLGLVAATGSCSGVGMAGLTLGGGYGTLIGRFGLALDNLIAADVVLADGSAVTADALRERELFWALCGGGGNFGVVTALRFRVHELPSITSGMLIFPFAEAKSVLQRYADILPSLPAEFTLELGLLAGPDGMPVIFLLPTWCGAPGKGDALIARLLEFGTALDSTVARRRYGELVASLDRHISYGQRVFMESCWLAEFNDAGVDALVEAMANAASPGCAILTHQFKGAATEVPLGATAFGLRRNHLLVELLASYPDRSDPTEDERHRQWLRSATQAFAAHALPGAYPNFLPHGDVTRATLAFGSNADRLIAAKRKYDPDNLFRSAIPLPRSAAIKAAD